VVIRGSLFDRIIYETLDMNKFVTAIKEIDLDAVKEMTAKDPKWLKWTDPKGRNALHFLCGVDVGDDKDKAESSLKILKCLLASGMDIDSIQQIPDPNCGYFSATPLWYAYTRGRNEKLYKYLLKQDANPENCMWAIAWYDDIDAAKLFIKHGAKLDGDSNPTLNDLFIGAFAWKKYKFAEWLLERGADINAADAEGKTALFMAVNRKDDAMVKELVKRGADPGKKDENGISARVLAEKKGPKRVLAALNN
jgi:ankyrin repeat protein